MARRAGGFRRAVNRPNYDWEGVTTLSSGLAAGGVTEAALFVADSAETLVRMRGSVFAAISVSGSAAGDRCVIGMGLIVAPTGATVAVDPINEQGANWFWHTLLTLHTSGIVGAVADQGAQGWQREVVDNKAMRKLREDESIFFVVANQDVAGAPPVDLFAGFRVLTRR